MTSAGEAGDRLSSWCGWVLVGAAALTPVLAWLGPLGFAALLALMGLLSLPAFRVATSDRIVLGTLLAGLAWALVSMRWSVFQPRDPGASTALKLCLELPLYWAAVCGARRADPRLVRRAVLILAWGMAAFGALLLVEAATGGAVYRWLHVAFYEPIRPDLARKNLGHATFVLALLWPLLTVAGWRAGATPWLGLPMAAGLAAAAAMFGFDAPMISLAVCPLVGLAAYAWPKTYPRLLAGKIVFFFVAAPLIVWVWRGWLGWSQAQAAAPLSWAQRMGYWSHAADLIGHKPLLGWGLDASRTFAPAIELHPHDSALQLWLELGVVGAVLAAAFWGVILARLSRPGRDVVAAATAASASAYLLFGALNFGVWQEWWLALGAFLAVVAVMAGRATSGATVRPST